MKLCRIAALLLAALCSPGPACGEEPLYLGILAGVTVRVAFQFHDGKWAPMPVDDVNPKTMAARYPVSVTWTIAFDGRNLGTVKSVRLKQYSNRSELGLQELTPESQAAVKALPAAIRMNGEEARRLVVVSRPNYRDPDGWKPLAEPGNPGVFGLARAAFRKEAKKEEEPCDCPESLVRVCTKPYRSRRDDVLIGLIPSDGNCACHPYEEWFLIRAGKATHFRSIEFGGAALQLIDAGDYDSGGSSEVLFFEEGIGDARDSFVLFSPRDVSAQEFVLPGEYSF